MFQIYSAVNRSSIRASQIVLWCCISVMICSAATAHISGPDTEVRYKETTGEEQKFFSWQVKAEGPRHNVHVWEGDKRYVNVCAESGETLEWRFEDGEYTQLHARLEGRKIIVTGKNNGKQVNIIKEIDDRPWYQPLSYSLRTFLSSPEKSTSFWTIRPETLEIYALRAKKVSKDRIETVDGMADAKKVMVTVEGFLSAFWKATYWYRAKDGLFLKYKSVHGPVGTNPTIITLASVDRPKKNNQ